MATRARAGEILGGWHQLIEGLQASSLDFYAKVEAALDPRQLPNTSRSRVDWREAGAFSAGREYLRVSRARHLVDICGAPFGNGFFVSWWLAEARPSPVVPTVVAVVIIGVVGRLLLAIGGIPLLFLGLLITFIGLGILMSQGEQEWHAYLLAIPVLGGLWERIFLPATYYRADTANMFKEAVHRAVQDAVDGFTKAQGLRGLTEFERKPVLREFYSR
jgi:hypothetical protein